MGRKRRRSLGTCLQYSLVADKDVKKPNKQTNNLTEVLYRNTILGDIHFIPVYLDVVHHIILSIWQVKVMPLL